MEKRKDLIPQLSKKSDELLQEFARQEQQAAYENSNTFDPKGVFAKLGQSQGITADQYVRGQTAVGARAPDPMDSVRGLLALPESSSEVGNNRFMVDLDDYKPSTAQIAADTLPATTLDSILYNYTRRRR